MDEVFEARIACSGVTSARCSKIVFLRLKFSVAASTTKSTLFNAEMLSANVIL